MLIHPGVCVRYQVFEDIEAFTVSQIAPPVMPRRTWDTVLYRLSDELHHQGLSLVWHSVRGRLR